MRRIQVVAAGLALLAAAPAPAPRADDGAETARRILLRLESRLQDVRTMKAHFVQTFVSSGLGVPQAEEGTFMLQAPDLMRWEYDKPEKKLAISDGTHTWFYLPEEKVVYKGSVAEWKEKGAFAGLVSGRLSEKFEAVSASSGGTVLPGHVMLELKPRGDAEEFTSVEIEIEPSTLDIASFTVIDPMGNRIGLSLARVEKNGRLPDAAFTFEPPRGVDVVDQSSPGAGR